MKQTDTYGKLARIDLMPSMNDPLAELDRMLDIDTGDKSLNRKTVEMTPKQEEFANAVFSGRYTRLLFGGGVGGGKTVGALLVLYALCKIYPGSRWVIVRQDMPTLRRTTLKSFWKTCPMPFFHPDRFNKSEMVAIAENGSQIEFLAESFSDDPELTRFDGLEVNGFLMEEANECQMETYLKCIERAGRWKINPCPKPYVLITCNPHQGYLKEIFYTPWSQRRDKREQGKLKAPYYFVRSLLNDNPYHSKDYHKSLEEIKKRAPATYRRMIEGSWDAEDMMEQLISWEYLYQAEEKIIFPEEYRHKIRRSLGVDVGRYGKDYTVWWILEGHPDLGYNCLKKIRKERTDQHEVFDQTKRLIVKYDIPHDRVCIDVVGIGGGVFDFLLEDGYDTQQIIGGGQVVEQCTEGGFKFFNFNSQLCWNVKLVFEDKKIGNLKDEETIQDLAAQGYSIQGERCIRLWDKEKMKEKLRRSPDSGDSFKYAVWGQIYDTVSPLPSFELI